jgi:hypothetical protein
MVVGGATVAGVLLLVTGFVQSVYAVPGKATYQFHCHSAAGSSDVTYDVSASIPPQAQQGENFTINNVVVTGTPSVPLLIAHLHIEFTVSPGTDKSVLTDDLDGPGSTNPYGPIAQPGVPHSTDPISYTLKATGAVGTTIHFKLGVVSSTVVNPQNQQVLPVECDYSGGPDFGTVTIIEHHGGGKPTPTTSLSPTTIAANTTTVSSTLSTTTTTVGSTTTTTKPCKNPHKPCTGSAINGELIGYHPDSTSSGAKIDLGLLLLAFALTVGITSRRARLRI